MKSQTSHKQTQRHQATGGTEQSVQHRAYELFLNRGQEPGHELEDWLQAEREVGQRQEQQQKAA
jgi:hypothetical protein